MSKYNSKIVDNSTGENQDNLTGSENFIIGPLKDKKSGQLKGDKKYISSNGEEILQDHFPRIISNESKEGDCSVNDLPFKSGGGEGIEKYINMIIDK